MRNHSPFKLIFRKITNPSDAEIIFESLYSQSANTFWLDSSRVIKGYSRFSFMGECGAGENDFLLTYSTLKEEIVKEFNGRTERINTLLFPYLNQIINESAVEEVDLPFKFRGGLVGYLGYELKKETVKATVYQSPFPDAIFFFITRFLAFDHLKGELYIVALVRENEAESGDFWIEDIAKKIEEI
ncbi:MAG: aminodeoxychorismate synthase component I, partial [Bacteroidetes bacterium]|nr:aminodeoxychorismate synthase component I [Bacteroidota bacterium]